MFAFSLSNNEDHTVVQQVLPFVMLVYHKASATLQRAGFGRRSLKFVYNRVEITKAQEQLNENRNQFVRQLRAEMMKLNSRSHELQQNFSNFEEGDFHYLGYLTDPVGYGTQVARLRQNIQDTPLATSKLVNWSEMIDVLLECLDAQDFTLNFDSVMSFRAAVARKDAMNLLRGVVSTAWSNAYRAAEKALLEASHNKPPEFDTLFAKMHSDAALVEAQERSRAAVLELLNKPENQDLKVFELGVWERFLEEELQCKKKLLQVAVGGQTKSVKTQTLIEAQLEARAKALLNDPEKKQSLLAVTKCKLGRGNFERCSISLWRRRRTRMEIKRVLRTRFRISGPKIFWASSRAASRRQGMVAKIGEFFQSFFDKGPNDDQRNQLEEIRKDMENITSVAEAHTGSYDDNIVYNAISQVRNWKNHEALDEQILQKCAEDVLKRLISVLTRKHDEWANNNTLCAKIAASRPRLRECFDIICDGLNDQETLCLSMVSDLLANVKSYIELRLLEHVTNTLKYKKWLRDEWQMFAQLDLSIVTLLEGGLVDQALHAAYEGKMHHSKVFDKFIEGAMPNVSKLNQESRDGIVKEFEAVGTSLKTKPEGIKAEEYETELRKNLPPDFLKIIPPRMWSRLTESFGKIRDPQSLHCDVTNRLKARWSDLQEGKVVKPTMEEVAGKLKEHFGVTDGAKLRCSECCPFCGMMCMKPQYHDGKHETIHQPEWPRGCSQEGGLLRRMFYARVLCGNARKGTSGSVKTESYRCDPEGWSNLISQMGVPQRRRVTKGERCSL